MRCGSSRRSEEKGEGEGEEEDAEEEEEEEFEARKRFTTNPIQPERGAGGLSSSFKLGLLSSVPSEIAGQKFLSESS